MTCDVVKIGSFQGVELPTKVLKSFDNPKKFEIKIENNNIILHPVRLPRSGWDEKFKEMHKNGDDKLLIDDLLDWDLEDV